MKPVEELTENDVVDAVCNRLKSQGFTISQKLTTNQQGDDIVAVRSGKTLYVEAKGATSARAGSRRFGRPFDSAQVRVHVAEAVYKAIKVLSRPNADSDVHAGIALPANSIHQREVASVANILRSLAVRVYWVRGLDDVQEGVSID